MKKIFWQCMLPMLIGMTTACKKEKEEVDKTTAQLLTGKEWVLYSVGFDGNDNGVIDNNEELIKDCEKDNTIKFNSDGQGFFFDKGIACGGPQQNKFTWILINNNTGLDMELATVSIVKLNEVEFIYTPNIEGLAFKFIISYRH